MLLSELQEDFALRGLQKFRAAQVYRWLHQRGATSFDEMTDLSKDLRVALKESFEIRNTEIAIRLRFQNRRHQKVSFPLERR